jgi:hypothetical protein
MELLGSSDIEGKVARVAARELGKRASFKSDKISIDRSSDRKTFEAAELA